MARRLAYFDPLHGRPGPMPDVVGPDAFGQMARSLSVSTCRTQACPPSPAPLPVKPAPGERMARDGRIEALTGEGIEASILARYSQAFRDGYAQGLAIRARQASILPRLRRRGGI